MKSVAALFLFLLLVTAGFARAAGGHDGDAAATFPPSLESYGDSHVTGLWEILSDRVKKEPFNLWATVLFLCAIIHTFLTHRFRHIAHVLEERVQKEVQEAERTGRSEGIQRVSAAGRLFHFLGEVEAVFGIWIIPLVILMTVFVGAPETRAYITHRVNYTEAVFVVVIMAIASTRPILQLAEGALGIVARLGGSTPVAWWFSILIVGPLLGSLITEPAAMTICAMLLSQKFYANKPGIALAYATLGLLFVNVSIGGTLTHFAAPPVLMVVDAWKWTLPYMLQHFGWKAALAIIASTAGYYAFFRKPFQALGSETSIDDTEPAKPGIPLWVTIGHVLFLVFAVINAHNVPFLLFGLLFFLAFVEVTEDFQDDFTLRPPILVGFFLAGLVTHGGLQQWWIAPVLGGLSEIPLMLGATLLTAFNDNAAITYLCTLVPTFTEGMKYAAVAGAMAGGGLTVIANAPNPAGQSILGKHFEDGIGALGLLLGALAPTVVALVCFLVLR